MEWDGMGQRNRRVYIMDYFITTGVGYQPQAKEQKRIKCRNYKSSLQGIIPKF